MCSNVIKRLASQTASLTLRTAIVEAILTLSIIATTGCNNAFFEERTKIAIVNDASPPSFEFSGSGVILRIFFYGPYASINTKEIETNLSKPSIWEIDPPAKTEMTKIPVVSYGILPSGFTQIRPSEGTPPKLIDEQCYRIIATTIGANEGSLHFCIRNGKAVVVDNP